MSAWIVDNRHIDVLVNALVQTGVLAPDLGVHGYREVGQQLWQETHRSVNHRYDEDTPAPAYRLHTTEAPLDPIQVLKAVDCYDYQNCEHPGWHRSKARSWTGRLRDAILAAHPDLGELVTLDGRTVSRTPCWPPTLPGISSRSTRRSPTPPPPVVPAPAGATPGFTR